MMLSDSEAPIFGQSPIMQSLRLECEQYANSSYPILLLGESGTGKSWLAREIHRMSLVKSGPFIECAIPHLDSLARDQLLGHFKGAFTGATERYRGSIEQAMHGSLFLDEIGTAPPGIQAILLTLIEAQTIRPLGSERDLPVHVRVVAATNEPLEERRSEGSFRDDLYHRISALEMSLPPLRKRRSDIPMLARHLLAREAGSQRMPVPLLSPDAIEQLCKAKWPGNLRELRNVLVRAMLKTRGRPVIEFHDLDLPAVPGKTRKGRTKFAPEKIQLTLARSGHNKTRAAAEIGCSRKTVQRAFMKLRAPNAAPELDRDIS